VPVYLVAYELRDPDGDNAGLHSAIASYDSTQLLKGVYLVNAPADADTLRRHLCAVASEGVRLWVSRLTEEHSGFVLAPAVSWLDERKPL